MKKIEYQSNIRWRIYYTNTQINDTLSHYYTDTQVNDTLNHYYTNTQINDTLSHYLQADALCDSIVKCDVIENMRDSIQTNATDIANLQNADSILSARITADSTNLANNYYNKDSVYTKTQIDDTLSHYLMHEEQVLRLSNDTIYLTGGSFVKLPAGFNGDYNNLNNKPDLEQYATNMHLDDTLNKYYTQTQIKDTLSHYLQAGDLCDSVVKCDVIKTLRDSIQNMFDSVQINTTNITNNTTNITNITNNFTNFHEVDSVLSARITKDSLALSNRMDTLLTHVCDSVETCVKGWISDSTRMIVDSLGAYYDTTLMKKAIHDTADVLRSMMTGAANDAKITIKKNGEIVDDFTLNQSADKEINISVPTKVTDLEDANEYLKTDDLCDSIESACTNVPLKNADNDFTGTNTVPRGFDMDTTNGTNCNNIVVNACDLWAMFDSLNRRIEKLEKQIESMQPDLTVEASRDSVTICEGDSVPVTFKATFHNCSRSDYTLAWKVNGTDSSNVTGDVLTFIAKNTGTYKVVCIATRSDNTFVTDSATTKVIVDSLPTFTVTIDTLTVKLSNVKHTATVQWDSVSNPVSVSGTSFEHTYAVADTITITAFSKGGCSVTFGLRLQPVAPKVTTDSANSITANTAIVHGTVTFDGGIPETRRGFVYSTSDQNLKLGADGVDSVMSITTGMGSYACNLQELVSCTRYYVRAFAINDVDTAYGEVKSFSTTSFTCGSKLTDIEGNEYGTLQLGSQCWMQQNLRTTRFADSTEIPLGDANSNFDSPFRFAPGSLDISLYGYLYNWAAAMHGSSSSSANPSGVQGICPDGWHMPSDAEWTQLTDFVASNSANVCDDNPAYIVKSLASTEGWGPYHVSNVTCRMSTNPSTNNSTGFSILPAGTWNTGGAVGEEHLIYSNYGHTIFRSASQYDEISIAAWDREFYDENPYIGRAAIYRTTGSSVRCVLDCVSETYAPTVSIVKFTDTVGTTVSMSAHVDSDGGDPVTERGVCWGTSSQPKPTADSVHTADSGTGIGDFAVTGNFNPGTTYYVRAYAINNVDTSYGGERIFVMPTTPTVTTTAATNVTAHTATTGGNVTADGGTAVTARGVCWGTSSNPTTENDTTLNGSGTGSFTSIIKGLDPNTTYYVRAYAINAIDTAYGDEDTIVTPNWSLSLTSDGAANIKLCGESKTVTYTATPSYGTADEYTYSWSCSNGTTITDTSANTVSFIYTVTGSYTVSCTAHHQTDFDIDATESATLTYGTPSTLLMCSEDLTITSKQNYENSACTNIAFVKTIYWGDGDSLVPGTNCNFSHTYASPGIYNVILVSSTGCDVTRTFVMGDTVPKPCMVAVAHTNSSAYTPSTGGLETTNSDGKVTTVADNNNHTYKVVQIGSQCWMAENLRTQLKPDGTSISEGRYVPDGLSADQFGYLYSWTAVMNGENASNVAPEGNRRGICPMGWHVPSDDEWTTMESEVYGSDLSTITTMNRGSHAGKLATGCSWTVSPVSTNHNSLYHLSGGPGDYYNVNRGSSCFDALPAGLYNTSAQYANSMAYFWTSSKQNQSYYFRQLSTANAYVTRSTASSTYGYSLRCVRDEGIAEPINLSVTTDSVNNIGQTGATLYGTISNPDATAITDKGFMYRKAGGNYTQATADVDNPMSANVTGLDPNTEYFFRAFAITANATVYGDELSFTTEDLQLTVTTESATNIGSTSAILHGSIDNPDPDRFTVTDQGFEWKKTADVKYDTVYTVVGNPYELTNLDASTEYTFRAFATVSGSTIYGDDKTFTTDDLHLVVTTDSVNIGSTSAILYGSIENPANFFTVTAQGFEWKETTDGNYTAADVVVGDPLSFELTGLIANRDYTFRAFATISSSEDTIYGDEITFTTIEAGLVYLDTLTGPYEAQDGDILVGTLASPYKITIAPGATVTLRDATISPSGTASTGTTYEYAGITCNDNATILLEGTNTVKGFNTNYPGIYIAPAKTLTIDGTGSLTATAGGSGAAGIGGGSTISCGNIVINDGTITATGATYGAGIGSGKSASCGDITINGGNVTATGLSHGTGIGTGGATLAGKSKCGNITITGGDVTAESKLRSAAAIGTGMSQGDSTVCGNISISGGTVTATVTKTVTTNAPYGAAGIGNGYASGKGNRCGNISITGGTVTATGYDYAVGIGNGKSFSTSARCICGDITIGTGVTKVTAKKGGGTYCIGVGKKVGTGTNAGVDGLCGTVTVGGTTYTPGVSPTSGNKYVYEP